MRCLFLVITFIFVFRASEDAHGIGKEMITSATYGVLAGTIVGAATLAFAENPGDNLHRVARGASLGLYAGILLGFYVTYGITGTGVEEYDDEDEYSLLRDRGAPRLMLVPIVGDRGLEGAAALFSIASY